MNKSHSRPSTTVVAQGPGSRSTVSGRQDATLDGAQPGSTGQQSAEGTDAACQPTQIGPYRLLDKLGEGGMGAVYRAEHVALQRLVALKTLAPSRVHREAAVARFEREMRAVGKLSHPNIVVAHDAGQFDGRHFLAMELVSGVDLGAELQPCLPLEPADACELIRQAAFGLDHAHSRGLVHRDIKPSNVMLADDGEGRAVVKVLDLGLAQLDAAHGPSDELTGEGQLVGTVDYMAPEQTDERPVDCRCDIYSLGATLYWLLSGEAPYAGPERTLLEKLAAMARGPAPSIRSRRSHGPAAAAASLPTDLADYVDSMIAPQRSERPRSAAEVAAALTRWTEGADLTALLQRGRDQLPGDQRPTCALLNGNETAPEPARKAAARRQADLRPWWIAATLVGLLAVLTVLAVRGLSPAGQQTVGDKPITVVQSDSPPAEITIAEKQPQPSDRSQPPGPLAFERGRELPAPPSAPSGTKTDARVDQQSPTVRLRPRMEQRGTRGLSQPYFVDPARGQRAVLAPAMVDAEYGKRSNVWRWTQSPVVRHSPRLPLPSPQWRLSLQEELRRQWPRLVRWATTF